jgi:hypothetical protein
MNPLLLYPEKNKKVSNQVSVLEPVLEPKSFT